MAEVLGASSVDSVPQKLQLVLATPPGTPDPGLLLTHSQLERIDSLSDQVAFLEEQLGACEYRFPSPGGAKGYGWGI